MKSTRHLQRIALPFALFGSWGSTWAQSIGYAPATSSVPTTSEWGLMLLALALASVAAYALRKQGAKALSVLFLAMAFLMATASEKGWLNTALATPGFTMSEDNGGTIDLSGYSGCSEFPVRGHPTIAMRILSVTPPSQTPTTSPTCEPGLVVNADGVCYMWLDLRGTPAPGSVAQPAC